MHQLGKYWNDDRGKNIQIKLKNLKVRVKLRIKSQPGGIDGAIRVVEALQDAADSENKAEVAKQGIRLRLDELYTIKASMLCQKARTNWQLRGE